MNELDMMRFKLIKEMSKEELIAELIAGWQVSLEDETVDALKRAVIKYRTDAVHRRLVDEADLDNSTLFGGQADS